MNEDGAAVPTDAVFHVKVGGPLTVVASEANLVGGALVVDEPECNGRPDSKLFATHNMAPLGAAPATVQRDVAFRYDAKSARWSIYNVDGWPIAPGLEFNVHRGY